MKSIGRGVSVREALLSCTDDLKEGTTLAARTEKKLTEIVRERRATTAFSPSPVHEEDLKRILQAGLEAPSSYNMQPWRFIVVRDPEQRKRLRVAAMGQEQVEQAP